MNVRDHDMSVSLASDFGALTLVHTIGIVNFTTDFVTGVSHLVASLIAFECADIYGPLGPASST